MKEQSQRIKRHNAEDFAGMRKAGRIASQILDALEKEVTEGRSTDEINDIAHKLILSHNALAAPLHYRGFPKSICTSLNHIVCHGIPSERKLRAGDILNIDVTVIIDGWHGDHSRMFTIGKPSPKAAKLITVTHDAMMAGIEIVKPGAYFGDIGHAIESYVSQYGFSVVEDFCGHGLGKTFHDAPNILHYGEAGSGERIEEGMFFTIEPMINLGKKDCKILQDGWTAVTRDKSLSAQYEHSIGVCRDGAEIFTQSSESPLRL